MLARCARCQGTFSTDRYGRITCPHCGAELVLPAPPGTPEDAPPPAAGEPPSAAPPSAGASPAGSSAVEPPRGATGPAAPRWPPQQGGAWGPPPPGWGAPPPDAGLASPFADRGRVGFLRGFFETWKLVATQPERFFARVRTDQAWTAILFGVIASTVGTLVSSIYAFFSTRQMMASFGQVSARMPEEQARFMKMYLDAVGEALSGPGLLVQLVLAPILTFVAIYVGAAVVHLVLLLVRGGGRGFDATLTAVAYTSGLSLLLAVPMCGGLLAVIWSVVSLVIGLGAIQRCGAAKAAAAVLAPFALVCVCACGLAGASLGALLKGAAAVKGVQTTDL